MSTERLRRLRKRFERSLPHYSRFASVQKEMAKALVSNLPQRHFARVLEIGVGTGLLTQEINEALKINFYLGIDLVPRPLKRLRFPHFWVAADAQDLSWLRLSFDLIISNATFQWFENPEEALCIYHQLLLPQGLLAFTTFGPSTMSELRQETLPGLIPWERWQTFREKRFDPVLERRWLIQKYFSDPLEALYHVRSTGALGYLAPCWSLKRLRSILGQYARLKTKNGYPLTYEPYLFIWRKA